MQAHRSFTEEFKADAVRLVLEEGRKISAVARDLDLTETAFRKWVARARAVQGKGKSGVLTSAEREELTKLRTQVRELAMERDILKKSRGLLRERERVRFRFIKTEKAEFPVAILCRAMRVSRSGFYAWAKRPESMHAKDDHKLAVLVKAAHEAGRCYYGSPRVFDELRDQGIKISRKRVIRLMQAQGLVARRKKRKWRAAAAEQSRPAAPNILARDFSAPGPNQRWNGDATELVIGNRAKLYLVVIMDLYSKFIVGWAVSASNDRYLAIKALENAIKRRCPDEGLLSTQIKVGPIQARIISAR